MATQESHVYPAPLPRDESPRTKQSFDIPVTAIGASAGGLEPIERFFDSMPSDSGSAFIIIQHLSPDFRSLMDELLARHSKMDILRIEDGMQLQPDCIYLNPPRSSLTIKNNTLSLEKVNPKDAVYLPIDLFFCSLAKDRGHQSIALILSGTGSDGTKGCLSISNAGGKVLVQDPTSTRFDGMPRSVISGVDCALVAKPSVLAQGVQRLLKGKTLDDLDTSARQPLSDPYLDVLSMLLFSHGTDFMQYKDATIKRRIERRAQMLDITDLSTYRDLLNEDSNELQELYADLLIEVTEFFRDQQAFELLQTKVVPALTANLKSGSGMRIWIPGCASGEEAYSIAILLQEQARHMGIYLHLKILATDIHVRSMNQASSGIYDQAALANVPRDVIHRYFDCADGQAQIKPAIRNMVFFSTHDVTRDPPFTRIDMISCRNLLIYLKEEAQEKVMNLLHFSLRKDGYLFLGPSEHIGAIANEFDVVSEKWRIYKKRRDVKLLSADSIFHGTDIGNNLHGVSGGNRFISKANVGAQDESVPFRRAQKAALEEIVERHAPPGFLLSGDGSIAHIFGNATDLVPMKAGNFSKRLIDLIRPELKVVVSAALDHSKQKGFSEFRRAAYVKEGEASATTYQVSLTPIELAGETTRFNLLSIEKNQTVNDTRNQAQELSTEEVALIDSTEILQQRISMLEHSLQASEESLQSTIEELETSNEELQSTNEELMSSNEELQSTNEELHSVNEELHTVSAEHQRKNEELTERETDLHVLLEASKIGTVHLDAELCLRRYTNNARSVFNIMPQDVGRPIGHITVRSDEHDIIGMIHSANTNKTTQEVRVLVEESVYLLRVMPYNQADHHPGEVLITVIDITDLEQVRSQLADLDLQYQDTLENTDSFFVRWDAHTNKIVYCNEQYANMWHKSKDEVVGEKITEFRLPEERQQFVKTMLQYKPNETRSEIYSYTDATGKTRSAHVLNRAISRDNKTVDEFQVHGVDCTDQMNYNNALQKLFPVFANENLDIQGKMQSLLDIGLAFFELETARITIIQGATYELTCIAGMNSTGLTVGTSIPANTGIFGELIKSGDHIAVDDVSGTLPDHADSSTESFIGSVIRDNNDIYGTVNFASTTAREKPYDAQEESLCLLIASWIGFLIGNQEQIDFMSNQTEYYKELFYSVPAMMFLCDKDGLILSASNQLCNCLKLPNDQVSGINCHQLFNVDNKKVLKTALENESAKHVPLTLALSDGSTINVELSSRVKPIGTLRGVRLVVLTDVSERNAAFKRVEDQNLRLEAANENLNQFAFIASHDLQEPLRKIQQFSSFLHDDLGEDLTGDTKYHLEVVVDASERMSTLIYDLLRYSGASQEEPKIESVPLNLLLEEVRQELELMIAESGATITFGELPAVQGDKALLRQLFINLIGNSIKYRSAERPLVVSITSVHSADEQSIVVSDNGIGFDTEFSKKIFDPFTRLHNSKQYKGNGIGLAICSTVCEKHNWTLQAHGKIEEGCQFIIRTN